MPWGLRRFQQTGQSHFVTFSCYHRRPLLIAVESRRVFVAALERVRRSCGLRVYGYVVMPEHVHLLLSEPDRETLAVALKSLKQGVSRRLIGDGEHFWQKRYYDFNIRNYPQFIEKLHYIHGNPVKRGLCERREDWEWSSFRHCATGCEGCVEIESEWTARRRERAEGKLPPAIELENYTPPFRGFLRVDLSRCKSLKTCGEGRDSNPPENVKQRTWSDTDSDLDSLKSMKNQLSDLFLICYAGIL